MTSLRLIVFDLDGTLIDSRRDLAESANVLLAGYGAAPIAEAEVARMVGCGAATLVKRVLTAAAVAAPVEEALPRFLEAYDQRLTNHTKPYDGVVPLLETLRRQDMRMALLTNKPLAQTAHILETFELSEYFRWSVGGDGPWPRKPAPEGLEHLIREASVEKELTVLVGDSSVDLQTARNAGVRICLARYGFGFADLDASTLAGDEMIADTPGDVGVLLGV